MNKRKLLYAIAVAIVLLALVLGFAGCGDSPNCGLGKHWDPEKQECVLNGVIEKPGTWVKP